MTEVSSSGGPGSRVVRDGLYFGEGPRWHDGRLWYSDFYDHAVHALAPDGADERVLEVAGQPSGLGWLPDGRMLVVSMLDRRVLRVEHDGTATLHADLGRLAGGHANDMVVDHAGRAYVGNFGFDLEAWHDGSGGLATTVLARVDPDGTAAVAADELLFPNGMVITGDGRVLVVAETFASRLTAFDVGPDGLLSGRRVWADLAGAVASPDGICLDAEGAVWVASATEPRCVRVGEGGVVLQEAGFSQRCFACMLGGEAGRTLYAMTAPTSRASTASAAPGGRIEAAAVAVPRAGLP
ncbi:MAG: SMP-30/gluconolactonase/LRE family protein [Acidimicrobiales bacterium]